MTRRRLPFRFRMKNSYLLFVLLPLFFVGLWLLVGTMVSLYGWRRLARYYATNEKAFPTGSIVQPLRWMWLRRKGLLLPGARYTNTITGT